MATPTVTTEGKKQLDALLDAKVAEGKLPALFFGAANADGTIYYNCKGDRVLDNPSEGQVDENTTLQLFSMTKLATSIAVLQLVEQGKIDLDDGEIVEKNLPELAAMPILDGYDEDGKAKERKRTKPITVRHLLTHTTGLAYTFTAPDPYERWYVENKKPSWAGPGADVESFATPLLFEPGERFMYGTSVDWAGILVWRLTGQTLEEYFKEHIFGPLGIKSLTFYPTPEVMSKLMTTGGRDKDGKLIPADGLRPIQKYKPEDIGVLPGGAGLLGPAKDYLRFLQGVLASRSPGGIIKPETFELLFKDTLPQGGPHRAELGGLLAFVGWGDAAQQKGETTGHSLGMSTHSGDSEYGRKKGSAGWGGISQTAYWIDPATGIAAICCTQISEEEPTEFKKVYNDFERTLYKSIA